MKEKTENFLSKVFLFKSVELSTLEKILTSTTAEIKKYDAGNAIFSPEEYERKIAFVLSGECIVERDKSDGTAIPLNTLKKYDSFGIMSLFTTKEEFPTSVIAKKAAELIFFTKSDVDTMIEICPQIAKNIIEFLADRVAFLNAKVATFSSDTVEKKLANFLVIQEKKCGSSFPFNCKKTAEAINAGRASLYRALASLQEKKVIISENKKIIITDLTSLERISK